MNICEIHRGHYLPHSRNGRRENGGMITPLVLAKRRHDHALGAREADGPALRIVEPTMDSYEST